MGPRKSSRLDRAASAADAVTPNQIVPGNRAFGPGPPENSGQAELQFTLRATILGVLLGVPLAVANLNTLLHIGWSFGVNITACLVGFTAWQMVRAFTGGTASRLGELESVSLQATASAAGYATGATTAIAFGAMLLLTGRHPPAWTMFAVTVLTGVLGVLFAIPLRAWLIDAEKLPFPSGLMTATTIRGVVARSLDTLRQTRILLTSLAVGVGFGVLRAPALIIGSPGLSAAWNAWLERLPRILQQTDYALPYRAPGIPATTQIVGFAFEPSFLLIGAGMVVGLRIAMSMLVAALLLYFGLAPWLMQMVDGEGAPALPPLAEGVYDARRWAVWPGTTLMLAATLTSLLLELPRLSRSMFGAARAMPGGGARPDRNDPPLSWTVVGTPLVAILLASVLACGLDVPLLATLFALLTAAFAAALAARVTGETDNTPTGPVTKLAQAGAALVARGDLTSNVLCGGVAGGAAMSAADLLQDMKTGRELGANNRKLVFAQILGAVVGAATIVPVWFALFPTREKLEQASPPPIVISATAARVFSEGWSGIPWSARQACLWAAGVGIVLSLAARYWRGSRRWLPSAAGLGMGWILPFSSVLSFAIGAVITAIWMRAYPQRAEADSLATASGLVAGESLLSACAALLLAVLATRGG